MEDQSNAVLANEIKHLTKAVENLDAYLQKRDSELNDQHSKHEARIAALEGSRIAATVNRPMKDRLVDNPGFWVFAASVVYVGGKDAITPILKAFGIGL